MLFQIDQAMVSQLFSMWLACVGRNGSGRDQQISPTIETRRKEYVVVVQDKKKKACPSDVRHTPVRNDVYRETKCDATKECKRAAHLSRGQVRPFVVERREGDDAKEMCSRGVVMGTEFLSVGIPASGLVSSRVVGCVVIPRAPVRKSEQTMTSQPAPVGRRTLPIPPRRLHQLDKDGGVRFHGKLSCPWQCCAS